MSPPDVQRVGIVAKVMSRDAVDIAFELSEWLRRRGIETALDEATLHDRGVRGEAAFDPAGAYGLVVVLGGDGTPRTAA